MVSRRVSIGEVIDGSRFTSYQFLLCGLCCLVTLLDGFDVTIIGIAAPKMAESLRLKPSALGLAMAAGQFGPLIGAIVLGMLADRFGRKWMLTFSAVVFGLFTLTTAFITNAEQLALYRFIAGLGLGGAIPNALALGSEFAPARSKSTFVTTMYAGMPAGGVVAALGAVWLIPHFGWPSLFVLGGIIPLIVAVVLIVALPESLHILVRRGKGGTETRKILAKIAPDLANDPDVEFFSSEKKPPAAPFKLLFTEGRAIITVLLWISFTGSLYVLWVMGSWAAMLLKNSGASVQQYSLAIACLLLGAVVATIFIGRLMDRVSPFKTLAVGFALAFLSFVGFGMTATSPFFIILTMSILCGIFLNGSNSGLLAVVTISYPPSIRGTGTGSAYAVAKLGAMAGPAVAGILLTWNWSVSRICSSNAVVCLVVAAVILILGRRVAAAAARNEDKFATSITATR